MILGYLKEEFAHYEIKRIDASEYKNVYKLQKTNPYYFSCLQDAPVTLEEVVEDILELPPNTTYEQKFYLGFFKNEELEIVMDYVEAYPAEQIVWIGFFMLDGSRKKQGIGKRVMAAFERAAYKDNFEKIRLGCVAENKESYPFWASLGFYEIKRVVTKAEGRRDRDIIIMEKTILLLGNPELYEISDEVHEEELSAMKQTITDLHDTLLDFRNKMGAGRAIAAPQIGIKKRILYMYIDKPVVFINPDLEFPDAERMEVLDDCMSFPKLYVKVMRFKRCIIHYKNEDWDDCEMILENDLSELIQHEYDHLNGILATMCAVDDKAFVMKD